MNLDPPPSLVELVKDNFNADSTWKTWLNHIYEHIIASEVSFITPDSVASAYGGTPVGSITDAQTLLDGNVYQIPEATGTPGFEARFAFSNVKKITGFVSMIKYVGSATHNVGLGLYNYTDTQDDFFLHIPHSGVLYSYRTVEIPDGAKYIDSNNNAEIVLSHITNGNASHDIYVDYVALIGKTGL